MAALAMLVGALAPALSHALGSATGATSIEVCTAQGSRWVIPDGTAQPDDTSVALGFVDCPLCSSSAQALGMAPASMVGAVPAVGKDTQSLAVLPAPCTVAAWVAAQPRAPPSRT
jgi:hypothetical protein